MSNKKTNLLVFLTIYILIEIIGVSYAEYRYFELSHHRDLCLFLEFPAKIIDPELTNRYNFAPEGKNMFGFAGTEGKDGFHNTIHFSPIKYTYILVYKLFPKPLSLFIFFSSLFFLPVLYYPLIYHKRNFRDLAFIILFVLFFFFSPNTLVSSTGEIRPRLLFSAFIPLTFLAIHYKRPLLEKVLFFIGLLAIREEGIIFGFILIIYSAIQFSDDKNEKRTIQILSLIYFIYVLVVFWYFFIYTSFPYDEKNSIFSIFTTRPTLLVSLLIVGLVYVVLIKGLWRISISKKVYKLWNFELNKYGTPISKILVFSLFFLPIIVTSISRMISVSPEERTITILYYSLKLLLSYYAYSIIFIFLLLLFVIIWDEIPFQKCRDYLLLIMTVLFIISLFIFHRTHPNFFDYFSATPENQPAALLMDLRDVTDPYETNILVGYHECSFFYDYNNLFVYWLLPVDIFGSWRRGYPHNSGVLTNLMDDVIDYIAVSKSDLIRLESIINATQVDMSVFAENEKIIILEIDR